MSTHFPPPLLYLYTLYIFYLGTLRGGTLKAGTLRKALTQPSESPLTSPEVGQDDILRYRILRGICAMVTIS